MNFTGDCKNGPRAIVFPNAVDLPEQKNTPIVKIQKKVCAEFLFVNGTPYCKTISRVVSGTHRSISLLPRSIFENDRETKILVNRK